MEMLCFLKGANRLSEFSLHELHLTRAWCLYLCKCLVKSTVHPSRVYRRVHQDELKFLSQPKGLILEKIQTRSFMGSEITKYKKLINYEFFILNKNPFEHSGMKLAK